MSLLQRSNGRRATAGVLGGRTDEGIDDGIDHRRGALDPVPVRG